MTIEKLEIPEVSDKVLKKYSHIKPVVMDHDVLFYMSDCDPRDQSFTWGKKLKKAKGLKKLDTIKTLHTFGYHGIFKPSVAEVIAQTPKDILNKAIAFRTVGPSDASDLNKQRAELDAGFHVAETTFYVQGEDKKAEDVDPYTFGNLSVEDKLDLTYCLTDDDYHMAWELYVDNPNKKWYRDHYPPVLDYVQVGVGASVTIGYIGNRPVNITIFWNRYNGKYFGFWEVSSQVADYQMIDEWFTLRYSGHKTGPSSTLMGYILKSRQEMSQEKMNEAIS